MTELSTKMMALMNKRFALLNDLVDPVRAAANQMKDAGMHRGADPLLSLLFQYDGVMAELSALVKDDPAGVLSMILE